MAEIKWDDIVNKVGEKIVNEYFYNDKSLREWIDLIVDYEPNKAEAEPKIEQEIREELNHLSTYRVPNSNTDLVSVKAVERVLNLVFRGHRDKKPKRLLDQEQKADYKSFCEWVANEIFSENWEYNKDSFAEIACRKLEKLGIVAGEGDEWKLKESEE